MFDLIRKHTRFMMVVLFVLIIPSFVLFGIDGYTRFNESATKVATVDGKAITQAEWDFAHNQEVDRLRMSNPDIDLALLDTPAVRYATLERLVRDRVLAVAAADEHLMVTDARLAHNLQEDPTIASLRRADGTLDTEGYRRLLAAQGLTPEGFEARVRADMAQAQVLGGVVQSSFASQAQANVAMSAFLEQRQARVQRFAPTDFAGKITPTDADLQAYYEQHIAQYQAPESASIEYLVLDLEGVKKGITVSEQDLRTYYEQNAASLGEPEQRRAAHILIAAPKDAPAAEREKARATADELLARLRQAPASFADVARASSQDDVSAASGGDLGTFRRDRGPDPAITEATYALVKAGDISDIVESDFGYHIVQLTELKPASAPPFEQLRPQLEDQLRTREAQGRFVEMAEDFRNGVYEQAETLQPVADKLKLTVHTANNVTRFPAPGATGALANPKFLAALFNPDAIERKRNTDALDIGSSQLASGRIVSHSPAHARPLDEVKSEVRTAFLAQRGAEMARTEGEARLKALTAKPADAASLPAAITLARDETHDQPPQVVEAVLRADPDKLPTVLGVDLGADGYAVAQVEKVLTRPAPTAEEASDSLLGYERMWAAAEARSYYDLLRTRYKARILVSTP
ncbi:MAG: SurA N-terminal domain-containing protein [Pseudomonadota bacterium]|nr:SurA N-terminal domain-containing protein [Pseudomonadota bacterium]